MFFIAGPILHVPVNMAFGSIFIFPVIISPNNFDVAFNESNSVTVTLPLIIPDTSAFWHITLPSMVPDEPTTNFPEIEMFPLSVQSILISPFEVMLPIMLVPFPIKLIDAPSIAEDLFTF